MATLSSVPFSAQSANPFVFELNRLSRDIDAALLKRAGGAALASMAALGLGTAPSLVHAGTFTVNSLADPGTGTCDATECTLREAIAAANANNNGPGVVDEVTFASSLTGTITLGGSEIEITDELTISGPGADVITVDAVDQSRIFSATSTTSLTTISGLTLTQGNTADDGGAIYSYSALALSGVTISNSYAGYEGGGFYIEYGDATLTNSTVSGNTAADDGGGFYINNGNATLTDSTVSGNTAANDGGGFYVDSNGNATLTNSTVSGNTAGDYGGGFYVDTGDATLTNSTVSGNTAADEGGGFYIHYGDATLTNSTVSGNTAADEGGGFYVDNGTATLIHSTVTNNTATTGDGGGLYVDSSTDAIVLENSIVAGNTAGGSGPDIYSGAVTSSFSLVGIYDDGPYSFTDTGGSILGTSASPVDAELGPLQDNGGPTLTHAIDAASPAYNAGDPDFTPPPAYDQRGAPFSRVVAGRLDMGSFEVQQAAPPPDPSVTVVSLSLSVTNTPEGDSTTLTATLDEPAPGEVAINVGFSGQAQAGTDFTVVPNPIVIAQGDTTGQARINATDDTAVEGDEAFTVTVQAVTCTPNCQVDIPTPPPGADGLITDDDQAQAATPIPALGPLGLILLPFLIPIAGWRYWRRRLNT